jgi:tripartite-type tricarboxylate transporter receptor subunit TctC
VGFGCAHIDPSIAAPEADLEPTRDLVPISSTVDAFVAIGVPESLKVRSLTEFVTLARAHPGKLNYYPLNGGSFSILLAGFVKSQGLDMVQVNYRDAGRGLQDLAAGSIHLMMSGIMGQTPLAQAGKLRLLAVTNDTRSEVAPDVPTVTEAGYPELAFSGLQGFFGAADMPTERRDRIAADIRAVAVDSAVSLPASGIFPRAGTPADFATAIERQRAQMASLAKLIGLEPAP